MRKRKRKKKKKSRKKKTRTRCPLRRSESLVRTKDRWLGILQRMKSWRRVVVALLYGSLPVIQRTCIIAVIHRPISSPSGQLTMIWFLREPLFRCTMLPSAIFYVTMNTFMQLSGSSWTKRWQQSSVAQPLISSCVLFYAKNQYY